LLLSGTHLEELQLWNLLYNIFFSFLQPPPNLHYG
jgi:hypothetical protein